ncbi:MAG: hypothetical protein ACFCUX_00720 [Candidatus Methylacidiphilales bacterium]
MIFPRLLPLFGTLCLIGVMLPALGADMEPTLGMSFPLEQVEDRVLTSKNVLINKSTILPRGTWMRICFMPPEENSSDVRQKDKKNALENTFSRKPIKVTHTDPLDSAFQQAFRDRAFASTWSEINLFRGFMHKVNPSRYYVTYQRSEEQANYAPLFFPEGLFLASDEQGIEILSVDSSSRAAQAGFQAGQRLVSLEGLALGNDLATFLSHYFTIAEKNSLSGEALKFELLEAGSSTAVKKEIQIPRSLRSDPFG